MHEKHLKHVKSALCDVTKDSDNSEVSGSNTSSLIFVCLAFYPLSKM